MMERLLTAATFCIAVFALCVLILSWGSRENRLASVIALSATAAMAAVGWAARRGGPR